MEVIVNQWNGDENEAEEVSLQRRQSLKHSSSSSSSDEDMKVEGLDLDASKTKPKFGVLKTEVNDERIFQEKKFEVIETEVNAETIFQGEDIENGPILPTSDPPLLEDFTSSSNVTNESYKVITIKQNEVERQEFYLERVFQKPPSHEFYCPNCKACIQKVYIQKGEREQESTPIPPLQPTEQIRCSSCFSFLIPIGNWLFPCLVSNEDGALNDQAIDSLRNNGPPEPEGPETLLVAAQEAPKLDQSEEVSQPIAKGTSKSTIKSADDSEKQIQQNIENMAMEEKDNTNGTVLERGILGNKKKSEDSSDQLQDKFLEKTKDQVAASKKRFLSDWAVIGGTSESSITKKPETASAKNSDWKVIIPVPIPTNKQPELIEVKVVGTSTGQSEEVVPFETQRTPFLTPREPRVPASSKTLEILKSIVFGGFIESLASLSVVTSAASADTATLNLVALAIANLIGGLFTLGHTLRELKDNEPKRTEVGEQVDRYNELLGERKNFFLHAFIAILSFIVFGLVPPIVYGFTFRENDEKDFKLAAVAGASLLCITLLSIAKAYIKRPNSFLTYFQTVLYYVSTGALASLLSYLAGQLVKKLIERLGWFDSPPSNFAMQIPGISGQQSPGWGSY